MIVLDDLLTQLLADRTKSVRANHNLGAQVLFSLLHGNAKPGEAGDREAPRIQSIIQ